jgi:hypothetical protein
MTDVFEQSENGPSETKVHDEDVEHTRVLSLTLRCKA